MRRRFLSFVVVAAIFLGTLGGTVFAAGENDAQLNLQDIDGGISIQDIELYAAHRIFKDVNESDWFYDFADYAYYFGLFKGTSDNTFGPDGNMTRAMFATVIFRCYNTEGEFTGIGEEIFSDVTPDDYYYDAVTFCYYLNVIKGVGGGRFDSDAPVTRQEAATMIGRLIKTPTEPVPHVDFSDSSVIADWASEYVDLMAYFELMVGYPDGTFLPLNNMTRAECAKVLCIFHYALTHQGE